MKTNNKLFTFNKEQIKLRGLTTRVQRERQRYLKLLKNGDIRTKANGDDVEIITVKGNEAVHDLIVGRLVVLAEKQQKLYLELLAKRINETPGMTVHKMDWGMCFTFYIKIYGKHTKLGKDNLSRQTVANWWEPYLYANVVDSKKTNDVCWD